MRRGDEGEAAREAHHRLQLRDCSAGWPSCSGDELLLGVADQLVLQQGTSQLQQSARGFVLVPYRTLALCAASLAAFWTRSLLIQQPEVA